jgi:hypothetical protein
MKKFLKKIQKNLIKNTMKEIAKIENEDDDKIIK